MHADEIRITIGRQFVIRQQIVKPRDCTTLLSVMEDNWSTDPDGVSKCQRYSKRQSFRYGNNENSYTDDEELNKLLNVSVGPRQVTDGERRDTESQDEDHHRSNRYCCAYNDIRQPS